MMCKACDLIAGNNQAIYEDEKTIAMMSPNPVSPGHLIIFPKDHYNSMDEIPIEMISHFFLVASIASSMMYESGGDPKAGTNIIVNDGESNPWGHMAIDVIQRKENDGIDFRWEPSPANPQELESVKSRIKEETFYIGKDVAPKKISVDLDKRETDTVKHDTEDNYLVKQLDRMP